VHPRTNKKIRLRRAHKLFAQDRETMDEAFPGDIVGLVNPGEFHLGDTICTGPAINFEPLPQFSPEYFAVLRCKETLRRKQFERGLEQLVEEGAIQVLRDPSARQSAPILAAVGELQFDVVRFRLESEYDVESAVDWMPYKIARWLSGDPEQIKKMQIPYTGKLVLDRNGRWVLLMNNKWDLDYCIKQNPDLVFDETSILT
jgi:peptide chain release factor 3